MRFICAALTASVLVLIGAAFASAPASAGPGYADGAVGYDYHRPDNIAARSGDGGSVGEVVGRESDLRSVLTAGPALGGAYGLPAEQIAPTSAADDVLPKPAVSNTKLQNIVNDLYKGTTNPNRVGTGTTADAVRNELATKLPTGGKFHSKKAQIYINGLNKVLKQDLTPGDRLVAQSLLDDLVNALGGAP